MITYAVVTIIVAIICLFSAVGAFAQNENELKHRLVAQAVSPDDDAGLKRQGNDADKRVAVLADKGAVE